MPSVEQVLDINAWRTMLQLRLSSHSLQRPVRIISVQNRVFSTPSPPTLLHRPLQLLPAPPPSTWAVSAALPEPEPWRVLLALHVR